MMLTYEIVDISGWGYGYKVESADGAFRVFQQFKPGVGGKKRMTRAEAEAFAQELIASMQPTEVEAPTEPTA